MNQRNLSVVIGALAVVALIVGLIALAQAQQSADPATARGTRYLGQASALGLTLEEADGTDWTVFDEWSSSTVTTDTTEYVAEVVESSPVMTGGTNLFVGLGVDLAIGNSTGGTNSVAAFYADDISQDADNTETAFAVGGTGWDLAFDAAGNPIDLDDDGDTSIGATTDDTLVVEVSGANDFQITANTFTMLAGSTLNPENATSAGVVFQVSQSITYGVTSTVTSAVVPANADIIDWGLVVYETFDGTGADTVVCGVSADADKYIDDLDVSAAGRNIAGDAADTQQDEWTTSYGDVGVSAVTLQCQYTDANNDATQGGATFYVMYRVD